MNATILNIAAYKFIALQETQLTVLQTVLRQSAQQQAIKGTILLSTEGINLTVAGTIEAVAAFKAYLGSIPVFSDLSYRESFSQDYPFLRLIVRIKKEIIKMNCESVQPACENSTQRGYLSPHTFRQWYRDKYDMVVLDARNAFEVALGTFERAIDLHLKTFSEFQTAIEQLPADLKNKPIITFCTGGIRCEKAAVLLRQRGFQTVYQLEGGILNYFAQCQGDYFQGNCFVFDNRVIVDAQLSEITPKSQ